MRFNDWEVSLNIRFRPARLLKALGVVAAMALAIAVPVPAGTPIEQPPTVTELSRTNAIKVVAGIVDDRMSYLDAERRAQLSTVIVSESLACNLDPLWVLAVGDAESRLDHEAVSPTGARGLFQLIPSTWKSEVARRGLGPMEKFNVVHNARVGIGYLCHLAGTFKRPDSILLAYNQGPGVATAVLKGTAQANEEGSTYAPKVWASYKKFLAALSLPTDMKSMRSSCRAPERTIYTPLLGYSSDVHGPEPKPYRDPTKKLKRPAPKKAVVENTAWWPARLAFGETR